MSEQANFNFDANAVDPENHASRKALLKIVANSEHDLEWYPTTEEQLAIIRKDLTEVEFEDHPSVLDCGAGDGRALKVLANEGKKYAIEKSRPLLDALDRKIFVVGTDFHQQALLDKRVTAIFTNPPYSEYEAWAFKVIKEGNAGVAYLILPERWEKSERIQQALELRNATAEVLESSHFLHADRKARGTVHIVKVVLSARRSRHLRGIDDPFDVWFAENFPLKAAEESRDKWYERQDLRATHKTKVQNALVKGGDIVGVLDTLYQQEMAELMATYKQLCEINPVLLKELDVNLKSVREALKQKIEGLKDRYWKELFDHFDKVTDRLTTDSRKRILDTLTAHTHVDFSPANAHAIVTWVIKQSNLYFNDQLIDLVETLTEKANITLYKSNQKTFGDEAWRYRRTPSDLERYKLDYRIVATRCGGLSRRWSGGSLELSERATALIDDICTVAGNIGFDTAGTARAGSYTWDGSDKKTLYYFDHQKESMVPLFTVRAFQNGNLHLSLNQAFLVRLNAEFGRLKGWLKDKQEAAEELDVAEDAIGEGFGCNFRISNNSYLALGVDASPV